MERREREVGRSKCFWESRKIGHETWLSAKTGKLTAPVKERADVQLVSHCERIWRTFEKEKANGGRKGWCTPEAFSRIDNYVFVFLAAKEQKGKQTTVGIVGTRISHPVCLGSNTVGLSHRDCLLRCLSCMRGNFHVQFLGMGLKGPVQLFQGESISRG